MGEWERLFSDWRPGDVMEVDGVPIALPGLRALVDALTVCLKRYPSAAGADLIRELSDLYAQNSSFWESETNPNDDERRSRYLEWKPLVEHGIERAMAAVAKIVNQPTLH